MKRYWHSDQYKRWLQKRDRKRRRRHKRRRDDSNRLRKYGLGLRLSKFPISHTPGFRSRRPIPIAVPERMCLVSNPEEMSQFISTLNDCRKKERSVFLDLRQVKSIELNAVAVLLATMVAFKSQRIGFGGNWPKDESAGRSLVESRFFHHLEGLYKSRGTYALPGSSIYTHGRLIVDPDFNQEIIESAAKTIWGEPRRCKGVMSTLIELMQNTYDHASFGVEGQQHWWVSVQHLPVERRVLFCFVDFGVGVFGSLESGDSRPFQKAFAELRRRFLGSGNEVLLGKIFQGDLHRSVTKSKYRGKGLPKIYKVLQRGGIFNLSMITNDVCYSSSAGVGRRLRVPFPGTFVSWEMTEMTEAIK